MPYKSTILTIFKQEAYKYDILQFMNFCYQVKTNTSYYYYY